MLIITLRSMKYMGLLDADLSNVSEEDLVLD